jgi:hypothetical protein
MAKLRISSMLGAILALLGAFSAAQAAPAADKHAKVTIINLSDWQLDHFYMSPADTTDWGADQLGDDVIGKGEKFTLTDIPCNSWDIKVVDEDGDECVIESVDLCKETAEWKITSKELLACQAKSK